VRSSFVRFDGFYASRAALGAVSAGAAGSTAAIACALVTVGTRLAAVTYGWSLPTMQNPERR